MSDIPGLPARRAALRMCDAVLRHGETLDQAAGAAMQHLRSGPDRAMARAMAAEVMRWLVDFDMMIDSATKNRLAEGAKPRAVLRLMLAQWLRLQTPPHAVIATALPLLTGGQRRLAHGVFSTIVRQEVCLPTSPTLPDEVIGRWGEESEAIALALAEPPPLDLTLRDPCTTVKWAERLGGTSLTPGHLRLPRGTAVEQLAGFDDGAWWVQDLAASLPARLLGPGDGKHVLDLCAAPGGKTLQLAASGWAVTALDRSLKRLDRLRQNLDRTGLTAEVVAADALEWQADAPFDAILLDAPCTATGTCRRHPDVLHRIGPREIADMAEFQEKLLMRAATWLKPGGRLVYAVCSMEHEEGEEQAKRSALELDPIKTEELPAGIVSMPEGWVRSSPSMMHEAGGLDGFFIARFVAS
jgi:16S rRNA (cytosine967-C5)-methyltransferase